MRAFALIHVSIAGEHIESSSLNFRIARALQTAANCDETVFASDFGCHSFSQVCTMLVIVVWIKTKTREIKNAFRNARISWLATRMTSVWVWGFRPRFTGWAGAQSAGNEAYAMNVEGSLYHALTTVFTEILTSN